MFNNKVCTIILIFEATSVLLLSVSPRYGLLNRPVMVCAKNELKQCIGRDSGRL